MKVTRWSMCLIVLAFVASFVPSSVQAGTSEVSGKGVDANHRTFEVLGQDNGGISGNVTFETSIGDVTGSVDCVSVQGKQGAISGALNANPTGANYFMFIAKDIKRAGATRPRDKTVTWYGVSSFNCAIDGFGSKADDLARMRKGNVRVL